VTDTELTARLQAYADADHARQPVCTDCGRGGTPYEYRGVRHDGLLAYRGDRVCSPCAQARERADGIDILVVDDRPGRDPYVYNTVRDADKVQIWIPPELRGVDGRDLIPTRRRKRTR